MTYQNLLNQLSQQQYVLNTTAPVVRLWDKEFKFLTEVTAITSLHFDHKVNAAGGLDLEIPKDTYAAEVIDSQSEREMTMITIDLPSGYRWHGSVTDVTASYNDKGATLVVQALHNWQHLESVLFWANPLFPAQFQPMAADMRFGPARTMLSSLLAVNLARLQLPLWSIPTYIDFFDSNTYSVFHKAMWPIAVKPVNPITDTSRWCVISACFQSASEIINSVVSNDGGLSVEFNLWLPGDPQPWPLAHFTKPTYWVDVVDYGIERNFTGTLIDGLIKVGIEAFDDAAGFVLYPVVGKDVLGKDGEGLLKSLLKVEQRGAVPVYRAADVDGTGVQSHNIVKHKPLASQVVVGGKSPEFVNKAIDLGAEALAAGLMLAISGGADTALGVLTGVAPGVGAALTPVGQMVGGINLQPAFGLAAQAMHDKLFAYFAWENLPQAVKAGPYRFREVAKLGGTGLGLMLYQDIVNACWSQRAYISHEVEVENGHPYEMWRDIKPGQLVGVDIPGQYRDGHQLIHVARLTEASYTYDRTHANSWKLKLGDPSAEQPVGQRSLERIRHVMQTLNTAATNSSTI